jgi:hypothetical protein
LIIHRYLKILKSRNIPDPLLKAVVDIYTKEAWELLSLRRNELRITTGHGHLEGHLFKLWLVDCPVTDVSRHLQQCHLFVVTARL